MNTPILDLTPLPERLAVCRLPADAPLPAWAMTGPWSSITRTADELSIVCREREAPGDVIAERGWRALKVAGPLDFGLTGVLAALAGPLAEAGVSLFAVSTYDTDYVLVKADRLAEAVRALIAAGHRVNGSTNGNE
jgi:hypothetical protein